MNKLSNLIDYNMDFIDKICDANNEKVEDSVTYDQKIKNLVSNADNNEVREAILDDAHSIECLLATQYLATKATAKDLQSVMVEVLSNYFMTCYPED